MRGGGQVEFGLTSGKAPQTFVISVSDKGPGIANLPAILAGSHKSATGMGLGLLGAQRLMDEFRVDTRAGSGDNGSTGEAPAATDAADHGIGTQGDHRKRWRPTGRLMP